MAKSYQQLQAEIETLQKKAEALRKKELNDVIKELRQAIAYWGLTAEDLGLQRAAGRKAAVKASVKAPVKAAAKTSAKKTTRKARPQAGAPKYRDDQGHSWGGRGPRPAWLKAALQAGRSIDEFIA